PGSLSGDKGVMDWEPGAHEPPTRARSFNVELCVQFLTSREIDRRGLRAALNWWSDSMKPIISRLAIPGRHRRWRARNDAAYDSNFEIAQLARGCLTSPAQGYAFSSRPQGGLVSGDIVRRYDFPMPAIVHLTLTKMPYRCLCGRQRQDDGILWLFAG